jgi:CheY-like chemotaxis protein
VREGYTVATARSGDEALAMIRSNPPRAITLDALMPGMDGWTMLTALKADPLLHAIPVVMISMVDDRSRAYALGASEFLNKPVDRDRLVSLLRTLVPEGEPGTVLVVDDDLDHCAMVRRVLAREGYAVTEAHNGRLGLERLREHIPALILLDMTMPEMDGFEFIDEVRRVPEWSRIPIAVLTALDLGEAERARIGASVARVLRKGSTSWQEVVAEVRTRAGPAPR